MNRRNIFLISILCLVTFVSCTTNENKSKPDTEVITTGKFDWLVGHWERTNDQEMNQTYELWDKMSNLEYQGYGWTMNLTDTVWEEHTRLYFKENAWMFEVIGVNEDPTFFPLTSHSPFKFTCENPENEFPKTIEYYLDGPRLKAQISGQGSIIDFNFKRFNEADIN